ncbi:MAG: 2'-5' RNA ligase family protein [Actinomycetota bacterium]
MRETALLVEVPEAEPFVGGWRLRHDPVAVLGVPAHATALFPFVPPNEFVGPTLDRLCALCSDVRPFEYELVGIDRFPEVVWLRPSPDDAFRSLTRSLVSSFSGFPPYGGRFPDPQPHLTVARVSERAQDAFVHELSEAIGSSLPVRCVASGLSVFTSDNGRWRRDHLLPFGPTD